MSGHDERRRQPRHPTRIEVDYAADSTFLFAYITDISALGIFVQTQDPLTRGTLLTLRFAPPSSVLPGSSGPAEPFELQGEVVWIAEPGGPREPGMGIQFEDLTADTRDRLLDLIRAVAYLDEPQ